MQIKINQKGEERNLTYEMDPVGRRAIKTILFGLDLTRYTEMVEERAIVDGTKITSFGMSTMSVPEYHKEITLTLKNNIPKRILDKIKQRQILREIGE